MPTTMTNTMTAITTLLGKHHDVRRNLARRDLISQAIEHKEAHISQCGALSTLNQAHATGRIPKDTYMVKNPQSAEQIDWDSSACIALEPEVFNGLVADALAVLGQKERVYVSERCVGADSAYAMPATLVTDRALSALFADNMFRELPSDISESIFADEGFTIICLPWDYIDTSKYEGKLREANGKTVPYIMAMDFDQRIGLVYGTAYNGCIKKMMFTVMNYQLPKHGILPLHCSANEASDGQVALYLGLSGTGKTTISNVPDRALIGDDEHAWSEQGIANFENGCYAKLINLDPSKEPQIFEAVFDERNYLEHGAIIENALMYSNGEFDLSDDRLGENSRVSYPLSACSNVKAGEKGGHPSTIIFLTADAAGVLPPVAKLNKEQAMLWFMMGYTSKLAGTEMGVTEPKAAFSRFFGGPFMPCLPSAYADLLGQKMTEHEVDVLLVNTGWTGGAYGTGKRFDINVTRAVVEAALTGQLNKVEYRTDERFHFSVPTACPGVDATVLDPKNTWSDGADYDSAADALAAQFKAFFDKEYAGKVSDEVAAQCPGV